MAKIKNGTPLNEINLNGGYYIALVSGSQRLDGFMVKWGDEVTFPDISGVTGWKHNNITYTNQYKPTIKESRVFEAQYGQVPSYSITYFVSDNAMVLPKTNIKAANTEVSFTVTPDTNYAIESVTKTTSSGTVPIPFNGTKYIFTMPSENVIITVTTIYSPAPMPTSYPVSYKFIDSSVNIHNSVEGGTISFNPPLIDGKGAVGTTYTVNVSLIPPYQSYNITASGATFSGYPSSFVMPGNSVSITIDVSTAA